MWKSGFCLRAATLFYKQPNCENLRLIHRLFDKIFLQKLSTVFLSTFHKCLWINCDGFYRQELMFAVISRILFCKLELPLFRVASTLRMA